MAMRLTEIKQLTANCPRCFGTHYPNTRTEEPDVVVCIDGNFQHRRHMKASVEPPNLARPTPSLFLSPNRVEEWNPKGGVELNDEVGDMRQVRR